MKESLEFHIPPVGTVSVVLHEESARAYRWLRDAGEIGRLKELDHLGAIRLAWEGAHHPRWEYVAFIWSLVDRCAQAAGVHVGSRVRLLGGQEVSSGAELMKCWSLLLNVGHVCWTFAAERALLFEVWGHKPSRQAFPVLVSPAGPLRAWADEILREGRYYQFFQALAFIRLRMLDNERGVSLPWQAVLESYVQDNGDASEALQNLKAVYRRLRRAAYLALDTHYTPSVLRVDPRQLLSDAKSLARILREEGEGEEGHDELGILERHLYQHVYLAEPVLRAIASRELQLRELIRQSLRQNGIEQTIDQLARGKLQDQVQPASTSTLIRLPVWVPRPFDERLSPAVNARTFQSSLEGSVAKKWREDIRVSAWTVPYGGDRVVQVDLTEGHEHARVLGFLAAFREAARLRERNAKWIEVLEEDQVHALLLESIACALIVSALGLLKKGGDYRWEWRRVSAGPVALFTDAKTASRRAATLSKDAKLPDEVRAEFQGLGQLLSLKGTAMIAVTLSRLVGYARDSPQQSIELDGCVVEVKGSGIAITLIEVKRRNTGGQAAAKKQLRDALAKLGAAGTVRANTAGRVSTAWVEIVLPAAKEPDAA